MALQAFVDDSGSSKGPIFVLGGFISSSDRWEKFADAWAKALAESPSIKYYKNSQAMSRKDEFDGWSYTDVQTKVSRLIKVIVQYATHRISVSISDDEFHKYIHSKDIPAMTDPYYILFLSLVGMSTLYFDKQKEKNPISFIFDEHGRIGQNATEMMETLMKSIRMHFTETQVELLAGIPTFADDKKVMQLQAADLYSGNVRRFHIDNRKLYMPLRAPMRDLMGIPSINRTLDARQIAVSAARNIFRFLPARDDKD